MTQPQGRQGEFDAAVYFCPTSGENEHPTLGGFDVCCDRPELHRAGPATWDHRPLSSIYCVCGKRLDDHTHTASRVRQVGQQQ